MIIKMMEVAPHKRVSCYLMFILLLLGSTSFYAQQFPVDISVNLLPPYSLNLSDYGNGSRDLVSVGILLRDINEPSVQVRLDLRIEDNSGVIAHSAPVVSGISPIFIEGGTLLRLDGFDLAPYFRLENLVGIAPDRYHQSLPEGVYRFCFTVYDVLTGKVLSRDGCGTVYLSQNDPPILNIPGNGEQVLVSDPQNIRFNWTPRHVNATNVTYDFRMVELWDKNLDPQFGFVSGRRIYETSTAATTLLYGPSEKQLLPNTPYAWQVQARVDDQDGLGGSASFKNDGKSEIFHFVYSAACLPPSYVLAESRSGDSEKILWQGGDHLQYRLEYRNVSGTSSEWFDKETVNDYVLLQNLEPNTRYEFRVGGQCLEEGPYSYSQIQQFTTPTGDNAIGYNCGLTSSVDITNQESLEVLVVNDVFTAGDFPVTVKSVTRGNTTVEESKDESGNIIPTVEIGEGRFSGWGYIVVPYLGDTRLKVSFTNIAINSDYELTQGFVMTDFDPNGGGMVDIGDVVDNFTADDQEVSVIDIADDLDLGDITVNEDGSITITHPDGSTSEHPGGDNVMIVDGNGDIFYVDENGQVTQGGIQGDPVSSDSVDGITSDGTVTGLRAKGIQVFFEDDPAYQFGFDTLPSGSEGALSNYYETIPDGAGGDYHIAHKFLARNLEESLQASVSITDNDLSIGDLVFKTKEGEEFSYEIIDDTTIRIPLTGRFSNAIQTLYAVLPKEGTERTKEQIAGVITLHHYEFKPVSVTLVPVGEVSLPALDELTANINEIYNKAGVTMNINVAPTYTPEADLYGSDGEIDVEDSAMLSHYTKDQKALIKDYKTIGIDKEKYYVFVFGNTIRPSLAVVAGFMPLKGQFGFVFQGANQTDHSKAGLVSTLSHELGHGIFGLAHPFDQYGTETGATDGLMDYGRGVDFSHMDWQQIHDPNFRLYLFQDEDDAMLSHTRFITPDFRPFVLDHYLFSVYSIAEPEVNGAIYRIIVAEDSDDESPPVHNVEYVWNGETYVNASGQSIEDGDTVFEEYAQWEFTYIDTKTLQQKDAIQLYWNNGSCQNDKFYTVPWSFVKNDLENRRITEEELIQAYGGTQTKVNCNNLIDDYGDILDNCESRMFGWYLTPDWVPFTVCFEEKKEDVVVYSQPNPGVNGTVYAIYVDGKHYIWEDGKYIYTGPGGTEELQEMFSADVPYVHLYWNNGYCHENAIYRASWNEIRDKKGAPLEELLQAEEAFNCMDYASNEGGCAGNCDIIKDVVRMEGNDTEIRSGQTICLLASDEDKTFSLTSTNVFHDPTKAVWKIGDTVLGNGETIQINLKEFEGDQTLIISGCNVQKDFVVHLNVVTIRKLELVANFNTLSNFDRTFLFDNGITADPESTIRLQKNGGYIKRTIHGQPYYTPVLGLLKNQPDVQLKLDIDFNEAYVCDHIKTMGLSYTLKPTHSGVMINNLNQAEVQAGETVEIMATTYLPENTFIEIYAGNTLIGQLEVACKPVRKEKVRLVYLVEEDGSKDSIAPYEIIDGLNKKSFNQLFVQWELESVDEVAIQDMSNCYLRTYNDIQEDQTPVTPLEMNVFRQAIKTDHLSDVIDDLTRTYRIHKLFDHEVVAYNAQERGYTLYFLLNKRRTQADIEDGRSAAGVSSFDAQRIGISFNGNNIETVIHELGHDIGLPHTFEAGNVSVAQSKSPNNIMDYHNEELGFYRYQMKMAVDQDHSYWFEDPIYGNDLDITTKNRSFYIQVGEDGEQQYTHNNDLYLVRQENSVTLFLHALEGTTNMSNPVWMLGQEEIGQGDQVTIPCDVLINKKLSVIDRDNKENEIKINLEIYKKTIARFKAPDSFDGEFLFDDPHSPYFSDDLRESGDYQEISNEIFEEGYKLPAKNNRAEKKYYVPVLGVHQKQRVSLILDININKKYKQRFTIISLDKSIVQIDGGDSLEIIKDNNNPVELNIEAVGHGTSFVEIYDQSNELVGKLEVVCKPLQTAKELKIIYLVDEKGATSNLQYDDIMTRINKHSHNQLFVKWEEIKPDAKEIALSDLAKAFVDNKSYDDFTQHESMNTYEKAESFMKSEEKEAVNIRLSVIHQAYTDYSNQHYNWAARKYAILYLTNLGYINSQTTTGNQNSGNSLYNNDPTSSNQTIGGSSTQIHTIHSRGESNERAGATITYETADINTIPHELAHLLGLCHTFIDKDSSQCDGDMVTIVARRKIERSKSNNYMDYDGHKENHFYKYQMEFVNRKR